MNPDAKFVPPGAEEFRADQSVEKPGSKDYSFQSNFLQRKFRATGKSLASLSLEETNSFISEIVEPQSKLGNHSRLELQQFSVGYDHNDATKYEGRRLAHLKSYGSGGVTGGVQAEIFAEAEDLIHLENDLEALRAHVTDLEKKKTE